MSQRGNCWDNCEYPFMGCEFLNFPHELFFIAPSLRLHILFTLPSSLVAKL